MRVVALTFHDVVNGSDGASKSEPFYRISKAEFEQLVSSLRKLGYQTASSRQFRAWQASGGKLPERRLSGPSGVPELERFRPRDGARGDDHDAADGHLFDGDPRADSPGELGSLSGA